MTTITQGWLVYRMKDGEPEFMGIYQTREGAEDDIRSLEDTAMVDGLKVASAPFAGLWQTVSPHKPPLRNVE